MPESCHFFNSVGEIVLPEVLRESVTVVSGVAPGIDLLLAAAATVVTREELEQRAPQRLYQALESVVGTSKLGDGADSVLAVRNLGRGRTLIQVDGARVTAERRAGPSATFVDPAIPDRTIGLAVPHRHRSPAVDVVLDLAREVCAEVMVSHAPLPV